MRIIIAKIMELFGELGHLKTRRVTFWAKKIGPVIVRICHQLQNSANLIILAFLFLKLR
jgi:hypothetical protein